MTSLGVIMDISYALFGACVCTCAHIITAFPTPFITALPTPFITILYQPRLWFFQWSCMDVRVGLLRKLSTKKLMLLKCGVGEDS